MALVMLEGGATFLEPCRILVRSQVNAKPRGALQRDHPTLPARVRDRNVLRPDLAAQERCALEILEPPQQVCPSQDKCRRQACASLHRTAERKNSASALQPRPS